MILIQMFSISCNYELGKFQPSCNIPKLNKKYFQKRQVNKKLRIYLTYLKLIILKRERFKDNKLLDAVST